MIPRRLRFSSSCCGVSASAAATALLAGVATGGLCGLFNGVLITGLRIVPFIVTLGMLFLLRGATIGITRLITGRTQVGGLRDITDGTSNTMMAGEVAVGFKPWGDPSNVRDPAAGDGARRRRRLTGGSEARLHASSAAATVSINSSGS